MAPASWPSWCFTRAIAPVGRQLPLVPMQNKNKYLRYWGEWQERPQTVAEARSAIMERKATMWAGMMQDEPAVVVVDVDDFEEVGRSHPALLRRYLEEQPSPVWTITRRGAHLWYRVDGPAPTLDVRSFRGLDIKGASGLVILPGSVRDGSFRYGLEVDGAEVDPATFKPGELFARLPRFPMEDYLEDLRRLGRTLAPIGKRRRQRDPADDRFIEDDDEALRLARSYLAKAGPAVEGQGGHLKTRNLFLRLGDLGVRDYIAAEAAEEWNLDNVPPWSAHELADHVDDAYRTRTRPCGCDMFDPDSIVVDL